MPHPKFKEIDRAYGFDEIALVPGDVTVNPDQTNIDFTVRDFTLSIPILASAMDAIVDTAFAIEFARLGGLPVLNLEGVQTRYENPAEVLNQIAQTPESEVTSLLQRIYSEPIKEELISQRIGTINHRPGRGDEFVRLYSLRRISSTPTIENGLGSILWRCNRFNTLKRVFVASGLHSMRTSS